MLSKDKRLRLGRDISRVYSRGRYAGAGIISLKALETKGPGSRAVVVVSKKVSKKATLRNRLRRRVTAILEAQWQTVRPGYDIVVTVHEDLADVSPQQLQAKLRSLMERANLLEPGKSK
jgi:ribonuclease P protein component